MVNSVHHGVGLGYRDRLNALERQVRRVGVFDTGRVRGHALLPQQVRPRGKSATQKAAQDQPSLPDARHEHVETDNCLLNFLVRNGISNMRKRK